MGAHPRRRGDALPVRRQQAERRLEAPALRRACGQGAQRPD